MKNKYWGLWILLALALAIFTVMSFLDEISIGSHNIKKAPIKEALFSRANGDDMSKDSLDLAESEKAQNRVEVDSTPQVILLIGDSMTLNLAYRLDAYARQNGHELHAINWDSSNTVTWSGSDTLLYFIDKYHPTQIFVSLGSNELYLKKPDARRPQVRKILEMIGDIPFVWIGPPNWQKDSGINDMLEEECGKANYFRTDGMELARKKDHVHPTRNASALWIDSVMRWLPKSSHPFVAELPNDSLPKKYPNVVFLKAHSK